MIITEKPRKVCLLDSKSPLSDIFYLLDERSNRKPNTIPIYFYRYIGVRTNQTDFLGELKKLESTLKESSYKYFIITEGLTQAFPQEVLATATKDWGTFSNWKKCPTNSYLELYNMKWLTNINPTINWTFKRAFERILNLFMSRENNETIQKSFGISMLRWCNIYLPNLFLAKPNEIPKFIYRGQIRRNEIYFLILLSMLGCDVIYINPAGDEQFAKIDPHSSYTKLIEYSIKIHITDYPKFQNEPPPPPNELLKSKDIAPPPPIVNITQACKPCQQVKKSFEELANLSASVVLIKVYNENLIQCGSGSGVAVDETGLIITNYHVVEGGHSFGILIENNNSEFYATTILKKNEGADLALLKIAHTTQPIPIKNDDTLKRGQQIVAIGSPLGLMNTISDGIVAGFRNFKNKKFIQITAPISPGSSGGALLDCYGYLVGITAAGYDEGQNLNLAVPGSEIFNLVNEYKKNEGFLSLVNRKK